MEPLTRPARPALAGVVAAAVVLLRSSGCATNPVSGQSDFVMMSEAERSPLAGSTIRESSREYGCYDNEALQEYVQQVGGKVAAMSHRPGLVYRFHRRRPPTINARTAGRLHHPWPRLPTSTSEAELAAVLGHEIGHVTARQCGQAAECGTGGFGIIHRGADLCRLNCALGGTWTCSTSSPRPR